MDSGSAYIEISSSNGIRSGNGIAEWYTPITIADISGLILFIVDIASVGIDNVSININEGPSVRSTIDMTSDGGHSMIWHPGIFNPVTT